MAYFAPYIDASGIHMPTYEDRLEDLCSAYRTIFGQEAELSPAVPDYQLLSVFAKALDDTSAFVLSGYNSRNPAYASGQALDLLLPQYGLSRLPGETDAEARGRMRSALSANGTGTLDAMDAEIRKSTDVTQLLIRVNEEDTEADGIPPHTLAVIANNGNAGRIAEAIWRKKPPGIGTYGNMSRTVTDEKGISHTVKFSRPVLQFVTFYITLKVYDGFDPAVVPVLQNALREHINLVMDIGEDLVIPQLYGFLYQKAGGLASTFAVTDFSVMGPDPQEERERLICGWNEKFMVNSAEDVVITIDT